MSYSATEGEDLRITDQCFMKIKAVNENSGNLNKKLRITVIYGGCSGYKISFEFTDTVEQDDVVFERNGYQVIVDKESLKYIKGSTLDYVESLGSSKFSMYNNPNADSKCSCGSSFATAE
jgi:iron-sulfur cluster assembly accessory protein